MRLYFLPLLFLASSLGCAADLVQIYELAAQRDPTLLAAMATRNAALENRPQSVARLLPNVQVTGTFNQNWTSIAGVGQSGQVIAGGSPSQQSVSAPFSLDFSYWDSAARIRIDQPLYHREHWVRLSQADSQIAEAEAVFAGEQQKLILRTAQAYFNILLAQESLRFAEAEERQIGRQLEEAKARFDVGLVAITDVHEAQAGYDQSRAGVIKAENDLNGTWEALREIIGDAPGTVKNLKPEIPLAPPQPADIEAWHKLGQENNLGIVAATSKEEGARKNIDLQFADHYPTVDLVASSTFTDNNRPQRFAQDLHSVGVQVNVPVFSGGGVNSRVRQARYQLEAAQDNLDVQRRQVTRQVKDAYRGIVSSISSVEALKAAVISAQSALEASSAGFQVGTRTMVDILTAQRNLSRARRDFAQARNDYVVNSLKLREAASMLRPEDLVIINGWLTDVPPADPSGQAEAKPAAVAAVPPAPAKPVAAATAPPAAPAPMPGEAAPSGSSAGGKRR